MPQICNCGVGGEYSSLCPRCGGLVITIGGGPQNAPSPIVATHGTITRICALQAVAGGKELLRVPAGVTPAELRAHGFNDVADRMEGKPPAEPTP
jgi:hypothetical protein